MDNLRGSFVGVFFGERAGVGDNDDGIDERG